MAKVKVTENNIDELVNQWHESKSKQEIHEFLGLTLKEYSHWVETGKLIRPFIPLSEMEELLGRTSSLSSYFADCMESEDFTEGEEYLLTTLKRTISAIEFIQKVTQHDHSEELEALKELQSKFVEAGKNPRTCVLGIAMVEPCEEDIHTITEANSLIFSYCETQWYAHRAVK